MRPRCSGRAEGAKPAAQAQPREPPKIENHTIVLGLQGNLGIHSESWNGYSTDRVSLCYSIQYLEENQFFSDIPGPVKLLLENVEESFPADQFPYLNQKTVLRIGSHALAAAMVTNVGVPTA